MSDLNKQALIAFAEAQILAAQKMIASLAEDPVEDDETDEPAPRPRPTKKAPVKKAAPAPVPDDEDDEDDEEADPQAARRAELEAQKIMALKAIAIKAGFKPEGVRKASKVEIIDAILQDELEQAKAATADDDDADDETGDEDLNYTREDLEGMGIRKVRALAIEQGHTKADLTGLKLNEVIDLMLGEGDAEDDTAADDADEEGEEGGEGGYTRADFEGMSLSELVTIGREYERDYPGWVIPKAALKNKVALIEVLLADWDEEDDE